MDFSSIDLALQNPSIANGLAMHEANPSVSHHCLTQLSFESGLAERMTNFTDGWPMNNTRPKFVHDSGNQRVCHEVQGFEIPAKGTTLGFGNERDEGGHIQQDNSSTSEQTAAPLQNRTGNTSGKRKACKDLTNTSTNSVKSSKGDENTAKCPRTDNASKGFDEAKSTAERSTSEHSGNLSPNSLKESSKLQSEPPKDYIHVRARRGQATDSHSLAERVRREKISERMKFLQALVPGCSKVTGKAVMLDEIINYVQSLQRQIEILSLKLAAVDPRLDSNMENLLNKELAAQAARSPETILLGPDPLASYRDYQLHMQIQPQINDCNMDLRSIGTLCDAYLGRTTNAQVLPPLAYTDNFVGSIPQTLGGVCDGDLQSVVHMGNSQGRQEFFNPGLHGPGFLSPGFLKVEY
ncbi:hypothetical protein M758_6G115800 [Ceratodon purpureus]|uniref:BHLH domain-containing protein n=1 Tax=Ceratodon purpureus TaxID=3225 RepID=A0A8T0HHR5_CERPU|nr:hypothetical protein KC19_6G120400 [Ceratodon purpureus]KAG0613611.1 hypothetical protein M758_6G115800 [Ceratodon purpureus]